MRIAVLILLVPAMALSLKVDYHFEFSKLVVHIIGSAGEYVVGIDGATYTTKGDLEIPWSKGKMGTLEITPVGSEEGVEIKIDAIHDKPPKIELDLPEYLGLGVWRFHVNVVDDWDSREDLKTEFSIDGEDWIEGEDVILDTFFMEDGTHTLIFRAQDSFGNTSSRDFSFTVDTTPPDPPKFELRNPDMVIFPKKPDLVVLNPRSNEFERLERVDVLKREFPLLVGKLDRAGNVSRFEVIEPFPGTLVPISTRGPITSIMEDLLLLRSGAPYTILGKTVLPEDRTLVLGSGADLIVSPTGEFHIKGLFMNISPGIRIFGNGDLVVGENARIFLKDIEVDTPFEIRGGKMVYLNGVKGFPKLNVTNVEYLILENMDLESLDVSNTLCVFLYDSTVSKLVVDGAKSVKSEDSRFDIVQISDFTRSDFRNVEVGTIALDIFSRLDCVMCSVDSLVVTKGSRGRFRDSEIGKVEVRNFSSLELFRTEVKGNAKISRSELITKESSFGGEMSEDGAIVHER